MAKVTELELTVRARTASWTFSERAANAALKHVYEVCEKAALAEKTLADRKRAMAKAVYEFIVTVMPVDELTKLRRTVEDLEEGVRWLLPVSVREYFDAKRLPQPHFNALNPFLALYQHFMGEARLAVSKSLSDDRKLTTPGEVETAIEESSLTLPVGAEPEEREAFRNKAKAVNTKYADVSRWAWVVCAAIDMGDAKLLDKNPREVTEKLYPAFRRSNATLAMPLLPTSTPVTSDKLKEQAMQDIAHTVEKLTASGGDVSAVSDAARTFAMLRGFGDAAGALPAPVSDDAEGSAEPAESGEGEGGTIDAEYEDVTPAEPRAIAGFKPFVVAPTATMQRLLTEAEVRTVMLKVEIDADGKWRAVSAYETDE